MTQPLDTVIGTVDGKPAPVQVGTALDLAAEIHEELCEAGYSLELDDVEKYTLKAIRFWAAWTTFAAQRVLNQGEQVMLDQLTLTAFEYTSIKPLARAYADELQAIRMEAIRGMGIEPWGMTAQEAKAIKAQLEADIPRNAFMEGCFDVTIAGDILPSVQAAQRQQALAVEDWLNADPF